MLHDIAMRERVVSFQPVTPQVFISGVEVHESVDVDNLINQIANGIQEVVDSSLGAPG